MQIYIKGCYSVLGDIGHDPKDKNKFQFKVPLEDEPQAIITIDFGKSSIESVHTVQISQELWQVVQEYKPDTIKALPGFLNKLPPDLFDELLKIRWCTMDACMKVLNLVKYCLCQRKLNENPLSGGRLFWSEDKSEWKVFPYPAKIEFFSSGSTAILYEDTARIIQEYINDGFEPFVAMRHLHRARNESVPRYKWIEATIAAELAIKEFFIRYKPELKELLLEVPSPPLRKLYGSILECYAGERSPKVRAIANGVEIRNQLLHRPENKPISNREATEYVNDIEAAIYHLMDLLYPKDHRTHQAFSIDSILDD